MLPQERVQIGPRMSSSLIGKQNTKIEDKDHNSRQHSLPTNLESGSSGHKRRVIGPAMMPPFGNGNYQELEEEEEDIIGPILPKTFKDDKDDVGLQKTIQEFEERAERMREALKVSLIYFFVYIYFI
jgi:hypothetical protein